jgi:RimJ/RimL family protein N-acetyltransferase
VSTNHTRAMQPGDLELQPLAERDVAITERFLTDPSMMEHLGGAQSLETARASHQRFVDAAKTGTGEMFKIVLMPGSEVAGGVGYWEKPWQGELVYETGWNVFPPYQGRGVAREATRVLIEHLKPVAKRRFLHAYPSVTNAPSNGICRTLGFELLGEYQFEYDGQSLQCNDWRLDLTATTPGAGSRSR